MNTRLSRYCGNMIDSARLLGDIEPHWRAEVDQDNPAEVSIVWTEDLAFHVEDRGLAALADGEDVRAGVPAALESELRRLLKSDEVYVDMSSQDEPALEIVVGLTVDPATVERLADLAWPIIATLTNVFDPGTFNAEYVMGTVAQKMGES